MPFTAKSSAPAGDRDGRSAAEYAAAVHRLVARIPPGRAMTYGLIAEIVAETMHRGGPRQVGTVLSRSGGALPWWRVVNTRGAPPGPHAAAALAALRAEACPLTRDGTRVDLRRAVWFPELTGPAKPPGPAEPPGPPEVPGGPGGPRSRQIM